METMRRKCLNKLEIFLIMISDEQKKRFKQKVRSALSLGGILVFVGLSFMLPLFTRSFSGYLYAGLLFASTLVYAFAEKKLVRRINKYALLWLFVVCVMVISFLNSQRSNGAFLDMLVFCCGLFLVLLYSDKEDVYKYIIMTIQAFAIFYGLGILLRNFAPPVYRAALNIFPATYRLTLLKFGGAGGFSTNVGYTAGYAIAGIFATLADSSIPRKRPIINLLKDCAILLFLMFALAMTGKRGPIIFCVVTVVYCYTAPAQYLQKLKRYWKVFLMVGAAAAIFEFYRPTFSSLPIVRRAVDTLARYNRGEDYSSGRFRLYTWAWKLFQENTLLGIGWGAFRATTPGNVTLARPMEAHNIYLQLLCENGVVGFVCFFALFLIFWNSTRLAYCRCRQHPPSKPNAWTGLVYFSFAYQTFFLMYGVTGNPLYDSFFQMMYILSCMILVAYRSIADVPPPLPPGGTPLPPQPQQPQQPSGLPEGYIIPEHLLQKK